MSGDLSGIPLYISPPPPPCHASKPSSYVETCSYIQLNNQTKTLAHRGTCNWSIRKTEKKT